ncbi:MAG: Gfo/Idh/MocA family oxidoreductase [Planctomycetes bacterium]|nr:Gfo/Idh/MocA family oxidoreductase [Planctomycetota bacterium]
MPQLALRIGVVGAGGIVRSNHIPGFRAQPECAVVAVCNRSKESGEKVAKEFNIPDVETDWKKLVARKDLNVIVVGTWPYMHKDVTVAALKAGKHVLCESRMALNAAHAHAMLKAAKDGKKKHGLVTMLCPPPLGFRGDYVMKELVASGILGKPYQLYVRHIGTGALDSHKPIFWRQQLKYQGLNALTLGMLNEPVERWFGPTTKVLAASKIFTPKRPEAPGSSKMVKVERPDAISALAEMKNGMLATYMFSGVTLHPGPNVVEAWGCAGMIRYVLDGDRIFCARLGDKEPAEILIPPEKARTWQVEAEFVAAIREGKPVSPNFEEGTAYMEFTEAVERSSKSGKAVKLLL